MAKLLSKFIIYYCDFDSVLSHCVPSWLLYSFLFVISTFNVFLQSFAWIDQDDYYFWTDGKICRIEESNPFYISFIWVATAKAVKFIFFSKSIFFWTKLLVQLANSTNHLHSGIFFALPSKPFSLASYFW